jgi:hypothetical protein
MNNTSHLTPQEQKTASDFLEKIGATDENILLDAIKHNRRPVDFSQIPPEEHHRYEFRYATVPQEIQDLLDQCEYPLSPEKAREIELKMDAYHRIPHPYGLDMEDHVRQHGKPDPTDILVKHGFATGFRYLHVPLDGTPEAKEYWREERKARRAKPEA